MTLLLKQKQLITLMSKVRMISVVLIRNSQRKRNAKEGSANQTVKQEKRRIQLPWDQKLRLMEIQKMLNLNKSQNQRESVLRESNLMLKGSQLVRSQNGNQLIKSPHLRSARGERKTCREKAKA